MALVVALVRTNWSGTTGGPGLTQIAIEGKTDPHTWDQAAAQVTVDAMRTCWNALASYLPDEIKLDVSPVVDVYNAASGDLVGSYAAGTTPAQVVGTNAAQYAMAAGVKVNLGTGQIKNGRRVRGSVFIVPAAIVCYSTGGMVIASARTAISGAFNTMQTTLGAANKQVAVWSRPIPEGKKYGPRAGQTTPVTAFDTSEKTAILRGRRD